MHPLEYVLRVPQLQTQDRPAAERSQPFTVTHQPPPEPAKPMTPCIGVPFVEWASEHVTFKK